MSQKAWMAAYTKGSKSLQARLAKIHKDNPEFHQFIQKHGFGDTISKKQSEMQKSSVVSVAPVTPARPEANPNMDREAMIRAAAEKINVRKRVSANRASFGGELGGGFQMPSMGFRRYSESLNVEQKLVEAMVASIKNGKFAYTRKSRAKPKEGLVHPLLKKLVDDYKSRRNKD